MSHSTSASLLQRKAPVKTAEELALEAYHRSEKLMRLNERQLERWLEESEADEKAAIAPRDLRILLQNVQDLQADLSRFSDVVHGKLAVEAAAGGGKHRKQALLEALLGDLAKLSATAVASNNPATPDGDADAATVKNDPSQIIQSDELKASVPEPAVISCPQDKAPYQGYKPERQHPDDRRLLLQPGHQYSPTSREALPMPPGRPDGTMTTQLQGRPNE